MNLRSPLAHDLIPRLKPGFEARVAGSGFFEIIDPNGDILRRSNGQPIRIGGDDNSNTRSRQIRTLLDAGAIDPIKPRRTRKDPKPKQVKASPDNPILFAKSVLKDPRANPRERKLATQVLRDVELLVKMQGRVKQLGEEVSRLEDIIDRRRTA